MAKLKKAAKKVHRADRTVAKRAHQPQDTAVMRTTRLIAEAGDQPPLIALSIATLAFGLVTRRPRVAEAGARMLASHLLATGIKNIVKHSIDRTRPKAVHEGEGYRLTPGKDRSHEQTSFPSGHTAGAVAVARAAARVWPEGTPVLAAAATGIGALQLPIGKHYASDVAAGAVVGLVSEAIVDRAAQAVAAYRAR